MLKAKSLKLFTLVILGVFAMLLFWHFKPTVIAPGAGPTITPPTSAPPGTIQEAQRFIIEGDEFKLSPNTITIKRGSSVELTFKNMGRAPHNFTVSELGVATKTIEGGQSDTVIFSVPETPGAFSYESHCSVLGHKALGMKGTIEIK